MFTYKELEHDEIYEDIWVEKKTNGYLISKRTFYQLLPVMLGLLKVWRN